MGRADSFLLAPPPPPPPLPHLSSSSASCADLILAFLPSSCSSASSSSASSPNESSARFLLFLAAAFDFALASASLHHAAPMGKRSETAQRKKDRESTKRKDREEAPRDSAVRQHSEKAHHINNNNSQSLSLTPACVHARLLACFTTTLHATVLAKMSLI